jgi:predicted enzyme related to lactoylglutathione lyase
VATAADEAVGARRDLSWSQGGIMPLSPEMAAAGATTRWQPYFEVADCDAAAAAVTAKGRTVVVPASDVPGVGRFAVALDPDGAQFAVIASVPA